MHLEIPLLVYCSRKKFKWRLLEKISLNTLYIVFLANRGIKWDDIISKKLLPDEAYFDEANNQVIIYEKKYQQTEGSADEKPQTCAFKIYEYRKLFAAMGVTDVSYIYIFNDWFQKPQYKDMLEYIKSVDGCDYIFAI